MRAACWALAAALAQLAAAEPQLAPEADTAAAAACPALPALPAFSHQLAGPPLGCTEAERAEWLAHMKACRSAALRNISYHGGVFDTEQWTQDAFAVPMVASFDREIYDEIIDVNIGQSVAMARRLAAEEGILAGISSGATAHAAIELAKRPENAGKTIVVILASYGERYLSSVLYEDLRS